MLIVGMQISCSEDESLVVYEKTVELQFLSFDPSPNERTVEIFKNYKVVINSLNPLSITSSDVKIVPVINTATGKPTFAIVLRELTMTTNSNGKKEEPKEERGYIYDGNNCFIRGTITTYPDGSMTFEPADLVTQYSMNRCGYSNVA